MSFLSEMKRRNVFRVMLAYAVAGWLLVEIMEVITGAFEAPAWVLKVFISVLVLGLIPAMIFSWIYEITPEGIRKEASDNPEHTVGTARKLDIAVLIMLAAVAIGWFAQNRLDQEAPVSHPTEPTSAPAVVVDSAPTPDREGPPMVAVLPFAATSMDGESDFFATGVHDDLLTRLAQLQSIRVISRTSVLEYRGTTKNMRQIGAELGADVILEGGVQAAGDRLRINAQLIDARTDEHLWAETYDRSLSMANIFDIQAEIARSIASALNAALTDDDSQQLQSIPTQNMAAYRAFRRAMGVWDASGPSAPAYREALQEAVRLDPEYARAWAELVNHFALPNVGLAVPDAELVRRAEEALQRVHDIAPQSADYLVAQTYYV
jgi:TolB-like protein